jgi:hypothetical protein
MLQYVHQNKKFNQVYYNITTVFNFWSDSPMVKTWLFKVEARGSNFHTYNISFLGYLNFMLF